MISNTFVALVHTCSTMFWRCQNRLSVCNWLGLFSFDKGYGLILFFIIQLAVSCTKVDQAGQNSIQSEKPDKAFWEYIDREYGYERCYWDSLGIEKTDQYVLESDSLSVLIHDGFDYFTHYERFVKVFDYFRSENKQLNIKVKYNSYNDIPDDLAPDTDWVKRQSNIDLRSSDILKYEISMMPCYGVALKFNLGTSSLHLWMKNNEDIIIEYNSVCWLDIESVTHRKRDIRGRIIWEEKTNILEESSGGVSFDLSFTKKVRYE